jgi:glycerol-3-phosphate acyltransferase PlsY
VPGPGHQLGIHRAQCGTAPPSSSGRWRADASEAGKDGRVPNVGIVILLALAAYALGTFPSAAIVARAGGVEISKAGSGNPGASNVTRVLGWRRGLLVFVLDAAKGAIAAGVGLLVAGRPLAYLLVAAAALGHLFPVTRRFHGGKGVATVGGAALTLHPLVGLVLAATWFAVSRLTRKASVASIVVVIGLPVGAAIDGARAWEVLAIIGLGVLVMSRHLPNLKRLAHHDELELGDR